MALFQRCLLLSTFWVAIQSGNPLFAKPTWTFSVVVAVEKRTADLYQFAYSKPIAQLVNEQVATINANFNSSPNFNGIYNFRVDSVYVFDGAVGDEIARPHPKYMYGVVINGFSDNTSGGGWYGGSQTIYHNWKWDYFSGPFAQTATDGLTHEFGHARGAIDIYALQVDAQKNPVNSTSFVAVNSIMNYPYGNIVWDEHTTNLLNSTAGNPIVGDQWIIRPFPNTIGIKAVDAKGAPLSNVQLTVYPVDWFSNSVTSTPILNVSTTSSGVYPFFSNPYQPSTSGYPWTMRYCNFLIKATYNSVVAYKWMPLYDVQNAYFSNGANTAYNAEIVLPVTAPSIKLGNISSTSSCPGKTIDVGFAISGTFDPTNQFYLQFIDNNNNTFSIAHLDGAQAGTLSGTVPYFSAGVYRMRVGSSMPSVASDEFMFTITAAPANPTVQSSFTVCQNASPPILVATGQNLLWHSDAGFSTTTPIPNTSRAGYFAYTVTQTIDGCESSGVYINVYVNPQPTATLKDNGPLSGTLTSVTLTAGSGKSYVFGGPGLVSQNPTSGTALANASGIYSVTVTGSNGCSNTASLALAGTDLTPTLVLPQANFAASGSMANLAVNLFEVAGLPTTMSNVAITITAPLGYTIAFDPSSTSINVSGGTENPVAVDNINWLVTSSLADRQLSLVMKTNQFISANGKAVLGFTITRTIANSGSTSSITVNIANDATMGYDGNPANNVYARIINGL
ncbi:hypothetical protein GO730_32805 [Spirosoma sp. HMF3257]|uniref:Ig-like domain-containing protein n=1 Tax=Spirosoma telluris TaxID=2183553 RepID=A0A327NQJ6_9BACT|nr:hypothetical protein [Spirosoma telluris]RAI77711.1 hypothetical protein HMF3257_32705 [Spirosoma telluris]